MASEQWYQTQLGATLIGALIPIIFGLVQSYRQHKAASQRDDSLREARELRQVAQKYKEVRARLEKSSVVWDFEQPVILFGPRAVGKTSLMIQWQAPWSTEGIAPTGFYKRSMVPVFEHDLGSQPHFADPDVKVPFKAHLRLGVHDFPGEVRMQGKMLATVVEETRKLDGDLNQRPDVYGRIGVVVICMFDASSLLTDRARTKEYYTGELMGKLTTLVKDQQIGIERLILVFNKFDLLRNEWVGETDAKLFERCKQTARREFDGLYGVVDKHRVVEAYTVLDRANMQEMQGSSYLRGEAARGLAVAVAGSRVADERLGPYREFGGFSSSPNAE